ncbi:MAG: hypothetical protein V3U75_12820 [Methylococcaceae bacterium]
MFEGELTKAFAISCKMRELRQILNELIATRAIVEDVHKKVLKVAARSTNKLNNRLRQV